MSEEKPDGKYTQLELIQREEKAFQKFAALRLANDDVVRIPKIYYDITEGDHAAAAVLDEILFWTLPNKKTGKTALRVRKDGILWLAVSRAEWWERKRLTERQADRGIEKLLELGLIEKSIHRFNGHGTMHLRVIGKIFFEAYGNALQKSFLDDAEMEDNSIQDLNDLYVMMGMSESPFGESRNRESRNGDIESRNGDIESRNGDTLNILQPSSNHPPNKDRQSKDAVDGFLELNIQHQEEQRETEEIATKIEKGLGVTPRLDLPAWKTVVHSIHNREQNGQLLDNYISWCRTHKFDAPKVAQIAQRPTIILDTWAAAFTDLPEYRERSDTQRMLDVKLAKALEEERNGIQA